MTLFYGCSSLTSAIIPKGVTSIGDGAFEGCSHLTSAVIPEGVTSIGDYVFYGCSRLTSVVIPKSVTSIGSYTFYECGELTSVVIPEGVTSIGSYAFLSSGLTSVVIPDGVTSIGHRALYASNLATIYSANPIPPIWSIDFYPNFTDAQYEECIVYVPSETALEAYRTADVWKDFKNIRGYDFTGTGSVKADSDIQENAVIYDMGGRRLTEPGKGLNIINGKKVMVR